MKIKYLLCKIIKRSIIVVMTSVQNAKRMAVIWRLKLQFAQNCSEGKLNRYGKLSKIKKGNEVKGGNYMLDQSYYQKTDEIIEHYGRKAASLIPIMQDIQAEYRYLPGELLTYVAKEIGVKEAKAYSVATFYENFSFEPKGKYVIKVCDGTACHVRKSMPVKEALMKELGLSNKKHTTDDMLFTVETVSCLGACGLAPTLTVNDEVHPKMTPEKAIELLNELRGESV